MFAGEMFAGEEPLEELWLVGGCRQLEPAGPPEEYLTIASGFKMRFMSSQ